MTLYSLVVLILAVSIAWEVAFDRKVFASRLAEGGPYALSIGGLFWLYAVDASGVTPGFAVLLKLPAIGLLACATWLQAKSMWTSWRASRAKPRMSAHELMSLAEDLAKADRLRASPDLSDHWRARELIHRAVAQAARRA